MTVEVVLRMRWMPVNRAVSKRADGFIRYVQFRDHHPDSEPASDVDDLIRYVKHRDSTRPGGRLFDDAGSAGQEQRTQLVDTIDRSSRAVLDDGGPHSSTDDHAYYQIIISPKDARGLDLRAMTRAAMRQLARDAGTGGLPRWVAGEHRNTAHPHVHVVLSAKREVAPGRFRTMVITNPRRERMNAALCQEMARQREARSQHHDAALRAAEAARGAPLQSDNRAEMRREDIVPMQQPSLAETASWSRLAHQSPRPHRHFRASIAQRLSSIAGRLAHHYQREAEHEALRRHRGSLDDDHSHRRDR